MATIKKTDLTFNRATINLAALRHNFREVRAFNEGRKIMAVVRNDAYGHGLLEAGLALIQAGADALGVAEVVEGMKLRVAGVNRPIYLLNGVQGRDQVELAVSENLHIFAHSLEMIRELAAEATAQNRTVHIHIKVDAGLGRLGLPAGQLMPVLRETLAWPQVRVLGLATQLAAVGDREARNQLDLFDSLSQSAAGLGVPQDLNSALDGAGLMGHAGRGGRLGRAGLLLYGIHPAPGLGPLTLDLRPVMTVTSRVIQVRDLAPGDSFGFGRAFTAGKAMRAAVVPIGCAHGLPQARSNVGWALIRGRKAPLLGRVSTGLTVYDVTNIRNVAPDDQVVILGRQDAGEIKARQLAAWSRTVPYETLCLLGTLNYRCFEGSDYETYDKD